MLSIGKLARAISILGIGAALGGCTIEQREPGPEPLNNTPIATDQAMQQRDWQQSAAVYKSDVVSAWPDYGKLRPAPANPFEAAVIEPVLFVANVFYMPVDVVRNPPWELTDYKSLSVPPTYTAMPPLPPSTRPSVNGSR